MSAAPRTIPMPSDWSAWSLLVRRVAERGSVGDLSTLMHAAAMLEAAHRDTGMQASAAEWSARGQLAKQAAARVARDQQSRRPCPDCEGEGALDVAPCRHVTCATCEGTGYARELEGGA